LIAERHIKLAVLLALVMAASTPWVLAASPAEITTQRKEALEGILHRDTDYTVAAERWTCAMGKEPAMVSDERRQGAAFFPDAADACVAVLTRTARDRHLPNLYGRLLTELGGAPSEQDGLPQAIGTAALSGRGQVAIGNGKMMTVSPAVAFDAGFTIGYLERGAKAPGSADPEQLKRLSQNCLAGTAAFGACYSAGYMYGAKAAGG